MTTVTEFCKTCGNELNDEDNEDECVVCEDAAIDLAKNDSEFSFNVKCTECNYSGSIEKVKLHSCQIQEQGGRCEDYPCCGHTDGDGCQTLPEHTAEYWSALYHQNPRLYEEMEENGWG